MKRQARSASPVPRTCGRVHTLCTNFLTSLGGALRVLGLALVLLGLVTAITLRKAQAKLTESLSGFGQQIARLHELSPHSAPRKLMLNGLELRVMTLSTSLDVQAALDRFAGVCHAVGQIDMPATVRQTLKSAATPGSTDSLGILRMDAETEGFVACIDLDEGLDAEGLLKRLTDFGETKNLRSLGQFRYGLARRTGDTTTLVLFWTEGDAKLTDMFPEVGDAPGRDLGAMPRPHGATRVLSAYERGQPYGVVNYRVEGTSQARALDGYEALLASHGWVTSRVKPGVILARQSQRSVVVSITQQPGQPVMLSAADLGGR